MTPRLTDVERQAIVDGTDPISVRHRHRVPLTRDADVPAEPAIVAEETWANQVADRVREHDGDDRTLTDELPPGFCPRYWGPRL